MADLSPAQAVEALYEALTEGRYDDARALLHPDYRSHTQPHEVSPDALVAEIESVKAVMGSLERKTWFTMEQGDMGVIFHRTEGIDRETGDPIAWRSADFFRMGDDGLLHEHWDALTFDGEDLFDTVEVDA